MTKVILKYLLVEVFSRFPTTTPRPETLHILLIANSAVTLLLSSAMQKYNNRQTVVGLVGNWSGPHLVTVITLRTPQIIAVNLLNVFSGRSSNSYRPVNHFKPTVPRHPVQHNQQEQLWTTNSECLTREGGRERSVTRERSDCVTRELNSPPLKKRQLQWWHSSPHASLQACLIHSY
jgi:hypothetical protein